MQCRAFAWSWDPDLHEPPLAALGQESTQYASEHRCEIKSWLAEEVASRDLVWGEPIEHGHLISNVKGLLPVMCDHDCSHTSLVYNAAQPLPQ